MDMLTLIGYGITAIIGVVGGWAIWGKATLVLKEVAELLTAAVEAIEDGEMTKAEMEKIIQEAKDLAAAFK